MHHPRRSSPSSPRRMPYLVPAVALLVLSLAACGGPDSAFRDRPAALPQTVEVGEDAATVITLTGVDPRGEDLAFTVVDEPRHGTLQGTVPTLTYIPDTDYLGTDSFSFTVSAGERTSAEAVVTISVEATPFYAISRGSVEVSSLLYRVGPDGTFTEVGDTGHALITIKFDPTDGTLYGVTRQEDTDGACNSCLVTLDVDSAAVTVIGPFDQDGDPTTPQDSVPSLAFTSDGSLYGWTEEGDDAVSIDKATGTATVLGDSGLVSYGHGMFADADDTLWFINGTGHVYTVDPADGSLTQVHEGEDIAAAAGLPYVGDFMVRGDRDPATGKYWGVASTYGTGPANAIVRMMIDHDVARVIGVAPGDVPLNIHNLAFVR